MFLTAVPLGWPLVAQQKEQAPLPPATAAMHAEMRESIWAAWKKLHLSLRDAVEHTTQTAGGGAMASSVWAYVAAEAEGGSDTHLVSMLSKIPPADMPHFLRLLRVPMPQQLVDLIAARKHHLSQSAHTDA
jgi:hypothetical protein